MFVCARDFERGWRRMLTCQHRQTHKRLGAAHRTGPEVVHRVAHYDEHLVQRDLLRFLHDGVVDRAEHATAQRREGRQQIHGQALANSHERRACTPAYDRLLLRATQRAHWLHNPHKSKTTHIAERWRHGGIRLPRQPVDDKREQRLQNAWHRILQGLCLNTREARAQMRARVTELTGTNFSSRDALPIHSSHRESSTISSGTPLTSDASVSRHDACTAPASGYAAGRHSVIPQRHRNTLRGGGGTVPATALSCSAPEIASTISAVISQCCAASEPSPAPPSSPRIADRM
jgi:hypothetical protein